MSTAVDEDDEKSIVQGARAAAIQLATSYPIVSAYEFEFLKEEEVIRERLDNCTIYMIVQRPLTYFDNVELQDGYIYFEIADGGQLPLQCRVNLVEAGICGPSEPVDIETHFFTRTPSTTPPYRDVGALKIFNKDGTFVVWWSPQKILYEMLVNSLRVEVADDGDPLLYLDFRVHYIGKAFSQKVWDRLTGHDKMQRILTLQGPVGASPAARAPFEISLILLRVVGLSDMPELPYVGILQTPGAAPILHDVDLNNEDAVERFMLEPFVGLEDEALTREAEANLIHCFQPEFNDIKFTSYPNIKGGMRSKGYTWTEVQIEQLPAFLSTAHYSIKPVIAGGS